MTIYINVVYLSIYIIYAQITNKIILNRTQTFNDSPMRILQIIKLNNLSHTHTNTHTGTPTHTYTHTHTHTHAYTRIHTRVFYYVTSNTYLLQTRS